MFFNFNPLVSTFTVFTVFVVSLTGLSLRGFLTSLAVVMLVPSLQSRFIDAFIGP